MPNRFIKESVCSSENIDRLTYFQEVFFYRLIVNCDDFGRFDARLKYLSSRLFPLRDVTTEEVGEALEALLDSDLIEVYEVRGHPYLQMKTWEKHQQRRATESKYPGPDEADMQTDDNNGYQLLSDDINGNQPELDDNKCPRIRNRIRNNDIRSRNTREDDDGDQMISDSSAGEIQGDHDRVLDAAEDAGFKMSNNVRASLIALYADHGLDKVLEGLRSCSDHGAPNLAYLKACLKDEPRAEQKPLKTVPAQNYTQRNYDGEQEAALKRMIGGAASAGA